MMMVTLEVVQMVFEAMNLLVGASFLIHPTEMWTSFDITK